ncbi:hypothetical protein SAY86_013455 [Trapa natans]|uniref:Uncharacterized protein n=1 Tax=Trapa natans TaxID=22666 RepID=A0AAN7LYA8_TRANT|nr:hypothetical protein SAY86_013455 [Trapa natans]
MKRKSSSKELDDENNVLPFPTTAFPHHHHRRRPVSFRHYKCFDADGKAFEARSPMASHLEAPQQDVDIHARHFSSISTVDSEHNDEHGNPIWRNRVESWKDKKSKKNKAPAKANLETVIPLEQRMEEQQSTEASDTFSTVIPISKYKLRPYRIVIITRLIILALFFHYRVTISRTTYIDRLSAR